MKPLITALILALSTSAAASGITVGQYLDWRTGDENMIHLSLGYALGALITLAQTNPRVCAPAGTEFTDMLEKLDEDLEENHTFNTKLIYAIYLHMLDTYPCERDDSWLDDVDSEWMDSNQ